MALKLGLNLGYWGIGPQGPDAIKIVRHAESAGYESVWVAESYGSDVVSVLAWFAAQTERIKLGAGILQIHTDQAVPASTPHPGWTYREVFARDSYETFTGLLADGDRSSALDRI